MEAVSFVYSLQRLWCHRWCTMHVQNFVQQNQYLKHLAPNGLCDVDPQIGTPLRAIWSTEMTWSCFARSLFKRQVSVTSCCMSAWNVCLHI